MKLILNRMLNSTLLLTLSLILVFPIVFSGLAISPKIPVETGVVLGTSGDVFDGNLNLHDISEDELTKEVEFTVFPGQETYYRDFMEVSNEGRGEKRFRIKLLKLEGNISQSNIELGFRRSTIEVVLSPGESAAVNLVVHGRNLSSSSPFEASITFVIR